MADLLVTNTSQLVTLRGPARPRTGAEMRDLAIIDDGAMHIRDGVIVAVGPRAAVSAPGAEIIDAGGRIVLPGFIDAHTHAVFGGNRADEFEQRIEGVTYAELAARGGGIRSTVRKTREATHEDLLAAGRRYRDWFVRGGTTTVEAKSGYGLSLDAELKLLAVIRELGYIGTFLGAHEVPDEYQGRIDDYVDVVVHEMLPMVAGAGLAEYCDVFCEPKVFPVEQSRQVLAAAKQHGLGLRLHADQFTADYASTLAVELGAATADHLEYTTDAALEHLRLAHVQPVLLPGSVYALGSRRYPNARRMIELGLAVVIATDFNPGTSPTASMPMVLSLACTQMRMTPAEAITAATINAAHSLNRGHRIGSLEPAKQADFVIHDCTDYREIPYFFGREPALRTYIRGMAA